MRFSVKLAVSLAFVVALVALLAFPVVDRLTQNWFVRDLEMRSQFVMRLIEGEIENQALDEKPMAKRRELLGTFVERLTRDERLYAVAICGADHKPVSATNTFKPPLTCEGFNETSTANLVMPTRQGPLHFSSAPLRLFVTDADRPNAYMVVVHDMSFMTRRSEQTRRAFFIFFFVLLVIVASLSILIAHLTWRGWMNGIKEILSLPKGMRPRDIFRRRSPAPSDLKPIAKELRDWAKEIVRFGGYRDPSQLTWSPEALRSILQKELAGEEILIVSNREPYIHTKQPDGSLRVQVPASGLVTALEPIMRACSGTWIAHGSGSGDREAVDANDRVRVPPDNPAYKIRRVWLTPEQEKGYYYGFSNEGLWPLCHIAHTRPTFRGEDFEKYREVNRLFAETVVQEARTDNPVILVQDYHFALLPRMVKEKLPNATIITFWHIPWPNSEAFGICPWREEILAGLLGSSILGFHTRFHCHNFLDSVDRYLESRIERETMTVSYGGHLTQVAAYPISIEWPPKRLTGVATEPLCRRAIRERHGFPFEHRIAIGVDRLDYTKGILERFNGVERFLDQNPGSVGKFTLVQIGAPTRSGIPSYQMFVDQVQAETKRINEKFAKPGAPPAVLLLDRHHEPEEIFEYFRGSDACLVTSLHDGMNLVAKEFIGSRDDEAGVLILSQFAGAARELPEALLVNPYDVDQCAAAIQVALEMPLNEQRIRMRSMRGFVEEFNIYRWAGRMLMDAAKLRRFGELRKRATTRIGDTFPSLR
jgi:trehalose 6-phosphate synthase